MDTSKITVGGVLIVLGVLLLLANMGIIDWFHFEMIFDLWPMLLIMAGVNIIFKKNPYVNMGMWILFILTLILYGIYAPNFAPNFIF